MAEETARDSHKLVLTSRILQGPVGKVILQLWACTEPTASLTTAVMLPSHRCAAAGGKQHTSVLMRRCPHIAAQENKSIRSPQPTVRHFARKRKHQGTL